MTSDRHEADAHANRRTPAIVLGGHYGALSVARAFSLEGIPVTLVASDPHGHACHSGFVSTLVVAPDPADDGEGLLEALSSLDAGALLVPTLDEYVEFVSQHAERLAERFVFAVPAWDVLGGIIDKSRLYPIAAEAGVPIPRFLVPDSADSLESWRDSPDYPCIIKPYESRRFSEVYESKVLVARDFEDLKAKYADTQAHELDVMICEIIPGDDSSIVTYTSYIDSRGEVLAETAKQKLRQYPTGFGQGSVAKTIPVIPETREHALAVLQAVGYRGESSAEFRLDPRDGRYVLMEINARPIVTEWLYVAAGVNIPHMTYRDLVDDVREAPRGYDTDVCWIHNHWEPVNLVRFLRAGNLDVRKFLRPYGKKRVYAVPFFDDPVHFLRELGHNGALALRRMRSHGGT